MTYVCAGDNRLICDCHQRLLLKVEDSISFVNTKCSAPEGHAGKPLSDILKDGFPCPLSLSGEQACTISNNSMILVQWVKFQKSMGHEGSNERASDNVRRGGCAFRLNKT